MAGAAAAGVGSKKSNNTYEFNPRWKGYVYIMLSSLINYASISNVNETGVNEFKGSRGVGLMFGIITFSATLVVLVFDNCQSFFWKHCSKSDGESDSSKNADKYNYTKAFDGKLEGATLTFFSLWWIIGVAVITQVAGIAYSAFNIYFSSWLTLGACIYTLDQWSSAKDLLSIAELTGVSVTLKSWYLVFLSSMVAMGTAANLKNNVAEGFEGDASFSLSVSTISFLVSFFFILVHYRFINFKWFQLGGLFELGVAAFLVLIWTIEVGVVTQDGGIAATISGDGCRDRWGVYYQAEGPTQDSQGKSIYGECYIVWRDVNNLSEFADEVKDENDFLSRRPSGIPTETPSMAPSTLTDDDGIGVSNHGLSRFLQDTVALNDTFDDDFAVLKNITFNDTEAGTDDLAAPNANATINNTIAPEVNATPTPTDMEAPFQKATPQPSFAPSDIPSAAPTFLLSGVGQQMITCASVLQSQIPGSNLYLASWIAFFSSLNVALRWKAAQAISFAQAAEEAAAEAERETSNNEDEDVDDDDDISDDDPDNSNADNHI